MSRDLRGQTLDHVRAETAGRDRAEDHEDHWRRRRYAHGTSYATLEQRDRAVISDWLGDDTTGLHSSLLAARYLREERDEHLTAEDHVAAVIDDVRIERTLARVADRRREPRTACPHRVCSISPGRYISPKLNPSNGPAGFPFQSTDPT